MFCDLLEKRSFWLKGNVFFLACPAFRARRFSSPVIELTKKNNQQESILLELILEKKIEQHTGTVGHRTSMGRAKVIYVETTTAFFHFYLNSYEAAVEHPSVVDASDSIHDAFCNRWMLTTHPNWGNRPTVVYIYFAFRHDPTNLVYKAVPLQFNIVVADCSISWLYNITSAPKRVVYLDVIDARI